MSVGTGGMTANEGSGGGVDRLMDMMRFFSDQDAVRQRMTEFTAQKTELDEKLSAVGGLQAAKNLIAEADSIRAQADAHRRAILEDATDQAESLLSAARTERSDAERKRVWADKELTGREERIEDDERDIAKRKKALEQAEIVFKSAQEKLRLAERENDELRNRLQGKLAAIKRLAEE